MRNGRDAGRRAATYLAAVLLAACAGPSVLHAPVTERTSALSSAVPAAIEATGSAGPVLLGDTHCDPRAGDCNPCVDDVQAQFDRLFSGEARWDVHRYRFRWNQPMPPDGVVPLDVIRRERGNRSDGHVQGFVHTNSAQFPFAMSHDKKFPQGSVSFIERVGGTQLRLAAVHRIHDKHPSGMQEIGRYVATVDGPVIRLYDTDKPLLARSVQIRASRPGFAKAGGGLGMAKLADGRHLIVDAIPGGQDKRQRWVRFFVLDKALNEPQVARFIGQWKYTRPRSWPGRYAFSENVSVVTECKTGNLYTIHMSGENATRGRGFFRLSRIQPNSPALTTLAVYEMNQHPNSCRLRGAASVHARPDHKLDLYCHEFGTTDGLGWLEGESFYFRRGYLP